MYVLSVSLGLLLLLCCSLLGFFGLQEFTVFCQRDMVLHGFVLVDKLVASAKQPVPEREKRLREIRFDTPDLVVDIMVN